MLTSVLLTHASSLDLFWTPDFVVPFASTQKAASKVSSRERPVSVASDVQPAGDNVHRVLAAGLPQTACSFLISVGTICNFLEWLG